MGARVCRFSACVLAGPIRAAASFTSHSIVQVIADTAFCAFAAAVIADRKTAILPLEFAVEIAIFHHGYVFATSTATAGIALPYIGLEVSVGFESVRSAIDCADVSNYDFPG
jgi:hypothetical protein